MGEKASVEGERRKLLGSFIKTVNMVVGTEGGEEIARGILLGVIDITDQLSKNEFAVDGNGGVEFFTRGLETLLPLTFSSKVNGIGYDADTSILAIIATSNICRCCKPVVSSGSERVISAMLLHAGRGKKVGEETITSLSVTCAKFVFREAGGPAIIKLLKEMKRKCNLAMQQIIEEVEQ